MLSEIIRLCRRHGIRLSEKLSQNFLHAPHIIEMEVRYAEIGIHDIVLDIGAGFGFLTELLAKKARKVYAVEIDGRIVSVLRDRLRQYIEEGKVVVIEGDILKIELPNDVNKIVSNPPFHIISPLIFRLTRKYFSSSNFDLCVMIVQSEYAKKMAARPGEKRSRLSAAIQYFVDVSILGYISRRNFFPPPKVDVAIVRLKPRRIKHLVSFHTFEKAVRLLFNTPNRVLEKVIKKSFAPQTALEIIQRFTSLGINIRKRIRELTNHELEIIASILEKYI